MVEYKKLLKLSSTRR